ncbi:MAG: acetyl-CoA C-acyltransferase [Candidatus Abyssobacteria bacterium SURF_17]|uniref:Acetyl-CoA C-acyltransferase n=1 Tax=Candidatus Abyssobacteria bacterium SURF_17 TaxID=2093361 RepID=A0A419EXZ9_9BACT|nr:MAG: acetyl-CoA C-acyltransferase [Candidatus Abyssubacteria bacterium SURF_17]
MENVIIASGARTPIGSYGGSLRDVPVYKLGALVLAEAAKRAAIDPAQVEDVIIGQSYQNGECANAARMSVLEAGWPDHVPGVTLDRRCCSGLDAIFFGAMKIQTGNADIVIAGGMDSMSQAELYIPGEIRWGLGGRVDKKLGFMPKGHGALSMWGIPLYDRIQRARVMSQPIERYGELNSMMAWAEEAAKKESISRREADEWAVRSHQKAIAAIDSGKFKEEIVPVPLPAKKGEPTLFETDETPRRDSTLEKVARLPAIYPNGVCTAGNSSTENDGAAAVVLMSERKAKELGISPLVHFSSCAIAATDPTLTYPAVPASVNKALKKAGLTIDRIDLIEIQEAFAVQALADARLMGIKADDFDAKINVNGSGISLGHPIGATGVMRLITLIHEMRRRGSRYGLETICGGGGLGIAAVVEAK